MKTASERDNYLNTVDLTKIGQVFGILKVCFDIEELSQKCHRVITLSSHCQCATVTHCSSLWTRLTVTLIVGITRISERTCMFFNNIYVLEEPM